MTTAAGPLPLAIRAIAYEFAGAPRTVRELAAAGQLESEPALLERFGFERVHVAQEETPFELALAAGRQALREADADPEQVGLLLYGGAGIEAYAPGGRLAAEAVVRGSTGRFRYPATRLQYELGLTNAAVVGLDSFACTTLFGATRVARALCAAEGIDRALCVATEFYPQDAGREAIFNCTSDAACALLLERGGAGPRIAGAAHVTKGYYWDCDALRDEIVASYFPTAMHCVERALADAGWRADEVDWVIPHNVSTRSWHILLGLLRLPRARLWDANVARRGHTLAGDNFINLRDAMACGDVRPGERLLLFAYGYGAHWMALAVEA